MNQIALILLALFGVYFFEVVVFLLVGGYLPSTVFNSGLIFQLGLGGLSVYMIREWDIPFGIKKPDIDGVIDCVIAISVSIGFVLVVRYLTIGSQSLLAIGGSQQMVASVLVSILLAPVVEEIFFRGILYTLVKNRYSVWVGFSASAVVFALSHVVVGGVSLGGGVMPVVVTSTISGVAYAWVYEKRDNLVLPVVAHAVHNYIILFGL